MKKNFTFTTIIFFIIFIILICFCYKYIKNVNTISIKNKEDAEKYILNIKSYRAEVEVNISSNKNQNTYELLQEENLKDKKSRQEVINKEGNRIVIESIMGKLIIKNTNINLKKVYENYNYLAENTLYLSSFIEEYKKSNKKEIKENDKYYVVDIKIKKYKNDYNVRKKLFIDKNNKKIEKLEVYDINQKRTIYILYKKIDINN